MRQIRGCQRGAVVFLVVLAACVRSPLHTSDASAPAPTVVMVSIDGLIPKYVLSADEFGLRVPTLRRLQKEGSYAQGVKGVVPTLTYPSHVTLITGVPPARHGVINNYWFDPERENRDGWY